VKMTRRATSYVAESTRTAAISAEVPAVLTASPSAEPQLRDQAWRAVGVAKAAGQALEPRRGGA
jgi:hypothetical protein